MKNKPEKRAFVGFNLDADVKESLEAHCKAQRRSVSGQLELLALSWIVERITAEKALNSDD